MRSIVFSVALAVALLISGPGWTMGVRPAGIASSDDADTDGGRRGARSRRGPRQSDSYTGHTGRRQGGGGESNVRVWPFDSESPNKPGPGVAAVPEPTGALLFAAGVLIISRCRSRKP